MVLDMLLKISFTAKITNDKVLRRRGTGKEMVRQFQIRQFQYLGHLIRQHNSTTPNGRKDRRQTIPWLTGTKQTAPEPSITTNSS